MFSRWFSLAKPNSLIIGPRRSGKTTFLKSAFPDLSYISLDDFDYLQWAKQDPKGLLSSLGSKIIIDEIQRVPSLTITVKLLIDERKIEVLMTGSSSIGLLDSTADSLAGRIRIAHFPTACWGEEQGLFTHSIFDEQISPPLLAEARRAFNEALNYGGFPEVVSQKHKNSKIELLRQYRDTYFTRDLAQLSNIENLEGLYAILNHVGRSLGSHLEVSNFASESGLSHVTAKKYLNTIIQSELGFKLYGYHFGPAKRYVKAAKLYYADNGILTALHQEMSKGQQVENFVVSELEKRRKLGLLKADQFYYYKSSSGAEIDLLIEEENIIRLVEIKASASINAKDLRNLKDYLTMKNRGDKKIKGYLFYLGSEYRIIDDIQCLPIYSIYRGK